MNPWRRDATRDLCSPGVLLPLIKRADGVEARRVLVCTEAGQVVAYVLYRTRTRKTGRASLEVHLDPTYPELAPYVVRHSLSQVRAVNPGLVVEFDVPGWEAALVEAAQAADTGPAPG